MSRSKINTRIGLLFFTFAVLISTSLSGKAASTSSEVGINTPEPISDRDTTVNEEILPADVLARSLQLQDELDLIRRETGRPKNKQEKLDVKKAAPREVFFQTLTLFQKPDRLAFEFTGSVAKEPASPSVDEIRPVHVWRMLDAALERVLLVKKYLGINEKSTERRQSDVFERIILATNKISIACLSEGEDV